MRPLALFWAAIACSPLAVANVLQMASVPLALVSARAFRRVNMGIAVTVWSYWSVIIEKIHGTRVAIEGDFLPPGESAVVFANHQSMTDIVVMLCVAKRDARMADMRWMVKDSMRKVPLLGWAMLFCDFIFLKRDWSKDRQRIQATFERFRRRSTPVWLVLYPEGTRKTPAKHAKSMEHARKVGLVETEHVMLPRTKGFVASVEGLETKITHVYRMTIIYPEGVPNLVQLFGGGVRKIVVQLKRYELSDLPRDEGGRSSWLVGEFRAMNELIAGRAQR